MCVTLVRGRRSQRDKVNIHGAHSSRSGAEQQEGPDQVEGMPERTIASSHLLSLSPSQV